MHAEPLGVYITTLGRLARLLSGDDSSSARAGLWLFFFFSSSHSSAVLKKKKKKVLEILAQEKKDQNLKHRLKQINTRIYHSAVKTLYTLPRQTEKVTIYINDFFTFI